MAVTQLAVTSRCLCFLLPENWQKEMSVWCPSLKVLNYYGSQDERRHMRVQIVNETIEYDVILTTYNMVISSSDDRVLFR